MDYNRIYNCNFLNNGLPDHCIDLIVADPPYYRVKGDFDNIWPDFRAYLDDVECWAKECARLLSYNGTLIWFGNAYNIAYSQIILDRYFHIINNCTVEKQNAVQNVLASVSVQRSFFVNDERFLVYENNSEDKEISIGGKARNYYRTRLGLARSELMKPIIDYLNGEREKAGFSIKTINRELNTGMATHWFTYKSQFELPSKNNYEDLRCLFNRNGGNYLAKPYEDLKKEYEDLKKEYEDLKKEYEDLRRPFDMKDRQSDIFSIRVDSGISKRLGHPTVKDLNLIKYLISTTSRKGQLVMEPFMGSGTACLAAKMLGRNYIGYEIDEKYFEVAEKRLKNVQTEIAI